MSAVYDEVCSLLATARLTEAQAKRRSELLQTPEGDRAAHEFMQRLARQQEALRQQDQLETRRHHAARNAEQSYARSPEGQAEQVRQRDQDRQRRVLLAELDRAEEEEISRPERLIRERYREQRAALAAQWQREDEQAAKRKR
jgi:hypothetical protein